MSLLNSHLRGPESPRQAPPTPPGTAKSEPADPIQPATQILNEALDRLDLASSSCNAQATAKLAALVSPCYLHRRFDDAVNLEKILEGLAYDESMSHSRLVQTATGVREISKQLQRRPIKRAVRNVMIVTKARDHRLVHITRTLTEWLLRTPRYGSKIGVNVYVDEKLRKSKRFDAEGLTKQNDHFQRMLRYWTPKLCCTSPEKFDLVLTLGGDGTVLYTSWLFQRIVPPILSFSLGSLGFLTPFDFDRFQDHLNLVMGGVANLTTPMRSLDNLSSLAAARDTQPSHRMVPPSPLSMTGTSTPSSASASDTVADAGMRVNLRMRFTCTVFRASVSSVSTPGSTRLGLPPEPTEACQFEVLNEVVIDRGPSPYVSNLELFGDDSLLTVIQADGIIFSTPTGSTAYSLSAGGSLVHPSIPAILLTPICPHTLSFRPMLLNDTVALRIAVPRGSRAGAWCSFDGKGRIELRQGDYVTIRASRYPFAAVVSAQDSWIDSVSRTLRWNTREARQKGWNGGGRNKIETEKPKWTNDDDAGTIGWNNDSDDEAPEYDESNDENQDYFDIDFDDDAETDSGFSTSKDSGYGDDESASTSPAQANTGKNMGSPQRKLSHLDI